MRVLIRSYAMEATRGQRELKSHRYVLNIQVLVKCVYILITRSFMFLLILWPCTGEFTFDEHGTAFKTCNNIRTFKHIFYTSLSECTDECFRRRRCETIMFHHGMAFCALKDYLDITDLDEQEPLCLYHTLNSSTLESFHQYPCFNHTCGANEKCTGKDTGGFNCVKSECPAPPTIANAQLSSYSHDIGTRNSYHCKSGFFGIGTSTITCDSSANWTSTRFVCLPSTLTCPVPSLSYYNADLTSVVDTESTNGTVLHFTCRDGYKSTGETATSTCLDGEWTPQTVDCCHANSTHIWNSDCFKPTDAAGTVYSSSAARAFCRSIGGYWRWFNWHMRDIFLSNTNINYVLQATHKDWVNKHWNYKACAEENGETGDVLQPFDNKVHEVMSKNWTGSMCWWGLVWASGEPNGGDSEKCLVLPPDNPVRAYIDIPCDLIPFPVGFICGFSLPIIH